MGLKNPNCKKKGSYKMLCRALDFERFFGMTKAKKNGHEIWHMERKESL
jgi:hypothetical protein